MSQSFPKNLNLACGACFVDSHQWLNVDFNGDDRVVMSCDLLQPLPFKTNEFSLLYSSHFFEHIPLHVLPSVLAEWLRILRPGGVLRLVIPDCAEMFHEYLSRRRAGHHLLADFVLAEIIDQCVRYYPGGTLGKFYEQAANGTDRESCELAEYIAFRNGETLSYFNDLTPSSSGGKRALSLFRALPYRLYQHVVLRSFALRRRLQLKILAIMFGAAFVEQNISFANVGERHQWLWDFHQVKVRLESAGFHLVARYSHETSSVSDFPFYPLDINEKEAPRKGAESMYIEAVKPL